MTSYPATALLGSTTKALAQSTAERAVAAGEYYARHLVAATRNVFTVEYARYMEKLSVRLSSVRHFISDSDRFNLNTIYVKTNFVAPRTAKNLDDDAFICELLEKDQNTNSRRAKARVVIGRAGMGKSLFMRYAFLKILRMQNSQIPIFIEMRTYNRFKEICIIDIIHNELNSAGSKVMKEQIELHLNSGLFAILLDGFDEIRPDLQAHYTSEVTKFISRFPLCPILAAT